MEDKEYLEYLENIGQRGSKPGLSRISNLLEKLGNPEKSLTFIHVVGTNGKGSYCNMMTEILVNSGFKVGTFSSPAVKTYNEKIRLDGRNIGDNDLIKYTKIIYEIAEKMDDKPSQFEIETAIAFLYFKENKTDIAVLEAGMGGRDDATNVIGAPILAVFTSIGLDHVKYLGNSISKIAENKAGILKPGTKAALFYGEELPARKKLIDICRKKEIPFTIPDRRKLKIKDSSVYGSVYSYKNFKNIRVNLSGIHQIYNGILVVESILKLRELGYKIQDKDVYKGISESYLPARFEVISKEPLIIYDGAHNVNGFNVLKKNIETFFKGEKLTVVMGVMGDKAHTSMLEIIKPYVETLYTVTPENQRALDNVKLSEEAASIGIKSEPLYSPYEFIEKFAEKKYNNQKLIIVGTLYFYKSLVPTIEKIRRKNMTEKKIINIAIDGPSGAGKSTIAKALAKELSIGYLDTGAMYRTVALYMDRKIPELAEEVNGGAILEETKNRIVSLLSVIDLRVVYDESSSQHMYLGDEDVSSLIRTPLISMEASKVSAISEVRVYLVEMQRKIGKANSIIMDGRDIGTHVLPDATVKIFLIASPEERAKRRYLELIEKGQSVEYEIVYNELVARDLGDSTRKTSPLKQAEDAVLLDTSTLTLEESIEAARKIVMEKVKIQ